MIKLARSLLFLLLALGCARADSLYSNGTDPGVYSWQINYGYNVTNSFVLTRAAHVDQVQISIWDVDDANNPMTGGWKITSQPFGGAVLASGNSFLGLVQACQFNRKLYCQWQMALYINADLPAGTYWLQVDDVQTKFNTVAFWGQSSGPSRAYISAGPNSSNTAVREIPSESFEVIGTNQ